jgi:hypothetical protein
LRNARSQVSALRADWLRSNGLVLGYQRRQPRRQPQPPQPHTRGR